MSMTAVMNNNNDLNKTVAGMNELTINSPVKSKQKEDALTKEIKKLIDTSKKKLSSLDSQRILSVIDDAILKIEIATLFPYIIENLDRYSIMLGSNLCSLLKEYDIVSGLFTKSLSNLRKLTQSYRIGSSKRKLTEDEEYKEIEIKEAKENYQKYSNQLSDIIKSSLRLFRSNPSALNTIRTERNERSSECTTMIEYMNYLNEEMFGRLVTTPEEEKDQQRTTIQVMAREKKALSLIRKLDEELAVTTKEKEDMIQEKNDVIRSLKSGIQTLEQGSDLMNRKLLADAQKIESVELKNSHSRTATLQQDLIQMKQNYQNTINKHKESEFALRKRKYKIETEAENWIQNYDNDMTERQDEIDELSTIYKDEKSQLEELETRFSILAKEYNEIQEQKRIALEKREKAERELRMMVKAATILQSFWRAYKCRKMLKAKQKKGKKGKGGNGKKKKR